MNIIKFKDKIIDNPGVITEPEKRDFFNNHLKGKYAYWIHMRYAVPFESLTDYDYVNIEEDINELFNSNIEYLDTYNYELVMKDYVDIEETDLINNSNRYKTKNNFVPDPDITLEELKAFRTWLATNLLDLGKDYLNDKSKHVLNYYKNNMYDETIKILSPDNFGSPIIEFNIETTNCGCCGDSNLSSLYNTSINTCDPIMIYKNNLYNEMVKMFSNIDFWIQKDKLEHLIFSKEFLIDFKLYIDNIIKVGLPLYKSDFISTFIDCTCKVIDETDKYTDILNKLSISLDYIINNDIESHKNYIYSALHDWSSLLYEQMYWK